ncbi:MAG: hypothetical protein M3P10_02415 [Actinomycetota bacterium]|nr:hypothetical protein [Actinomycetota bacterium]
MSALYPEIEPDGHGMLDVGDGHLMVIDEAGHAYDHPGITLELVRATDRFPAR